MQFLTLQNQGILNVLIPNEGKNSGSIYTHRILQCSDGLEYEPLWVHLERVLVGSLDTVEYLVLIAVHGGILNTTREQKIH